MSRPEAGSSVLWCEIVCALPIFGCVGAAGAGSGAVGAGGGGGGFGAGGGGVGGGAGGDGGK